MSEVDDNTPVLPRDWMSRRRFLQVSALAAGGLATAGQLPESALAGSNAPFLAADYGGQTTIAWNKSVRALFTKRTGVPVEAVPIDYGKFIAQIKSGHTQWGWVDAIAYLPFQYPSLFEDIPWAKLSVKPSDLYTQSLKGAPPSPKSVLQYLSSYAIGYRTDQHKTAPETWEQFFDTKAFPGKRGIYNYPYGVLEVALLADGVPFKHLYPLDVHRAFKKLDTIKSDTVFWNTGAQSQELLVNNSVDYVFGWNNRFSELTSQGIPAKVSWGQNLQILDVDVFPKHYSRPELIVDYINAALDPHAQATFAKLSGNAPSNKHAYPLLDAKTKRTVSTNPEYLDQAVGAMNDQWWAKNLNQISTEWTSWAAG